MAQTRPAYQVWDDDTGNVIAQFGAKDEAVAFLHAMLDANGASGSGVGAPRPAGRPRRAGPPPGSGR